MIPISQIVSRLEARGLLVSPGPEIDLSVTGISDDSRRVRPGDLYCAIRGYSDDGHRYLKEAARAGATAALVESPDTQLELTQLEVSNSRRAAAIASQLFFGEPAQALTLIGVTGTNGKTTVTLIARHILGGEMPTAALGTLGAVDPSGHRSSTDLTTPGPVDFARLLSELKARGARCVVAEVSSHALTQHRVDGVEFDVGVFTNLSRDHLDFHSDLDAYLQAKSRLVDLVADEGTLVVNAEEAAWSRLPQRHRRVRFGMSPDCDYRAVDLTYSSEGSHWKLVGPDGTAAVKLPLLGDFNVSNALAAAAAVGVTSGMAVRELAAALESTPQIPGRLEVLVREPLIVRDYAHTPDALRRVLSAAREVAEGRLIVVFGCGGDRDRGKRPLMGRAAADGADYSVVTSDNPRTEAPDEIIADILPGMRDAAFEQIVNRRAAIARAIELAEHKDLVLLAGKGHETYQIVGEERVPFDEAEIVAELTRPDTGSA